MLSSTTIVGASGVVGRRCTNRIRKVAIAIHAHPDDIEFVMAGTLLLLRMHGRELHYMTLSDDNYRSDEMS